jgi:uroporphyrinogen-III synthase
VLRQRGWTVDIVPDDANAGSLIAALAPVAKEGMRVLYPASSRALPTIAKGLAQLGAQVTQVEAYRTDASASLDVAACRAWIERRQIGAVTFASPSAVIELERALGREDFEKLLTSAAAVAIGPTTARVLTEFGRAPVLAESATLRGLAHTAFRLVQPKH